nr:hypothetical protein [Tanacetum cinerariifolium]
MFPKEAKKVERYIGGLSNMIHGSVKASKPQSMQEGVAAALAERDADRSRNGDNNNDLGIGGRRQMATQRECSYTDFLKCQSMSFQGIEGVVGKRLDMVELPHESCWTGCCLCNAMGCAMQEVIEFATEMMDKKMLTHAERQAEHKRKLDDTSRINNINSSHLKGIMWHGFTLLGQEIRIHLEESNLYVLSVIITMMSPVPRRTVGTNPN